MVARSRSSASLTIPAALTSADGSMRMSRGASAEYENPRSGLSICIEETPRSSRIASASTPFCAPGRAIPELEPVVDTRDDDLLAQLRVLDQLSRNHHAALFVELGLGRPGEEVPLQPPPFRAERIQRGESSVDESIPIRTTE